MRKTITTVINPAMKLCCGNRMSTWTEPKLQGTSFLFLLKELLSRLIAFSLIGSVIDEHFSLIFSNDNVSFSGISTEFLTSSCETCCRRIA